MWYLVINDQKIGSHTLLKFIAYFYLVWTIVRFSFVDSDHNVFHIVDLIRPITFIIDPILVTLILGIVLFNKFSISNLKIHLIIFVLVFIVLLSIIGNYNTISLQNTIRFLIGYLRFIPFIYFGFNLARKMNHDFMKSCFKILIGLLVIQVFVNTLWYFDIFLLENERRKIINNPDWGYGLMENTHIYAMSNLVLISYGFYKFYYEKNKPILKYVLLSLVGFVMVVLAESKIGLATIMVSVGIVSLVSKKYFFDIKIFTLGIIAMIGSLFLLQKTFQNSSHSVGLQERGIYYFLDVFNRTKDYNFKALFVNDLLNKVPQEVNYPYLGAGPGVLASKFALDNPTEISKKYFVKYNDLNYNLLGNSILLSPRMGFTAILGDLGIIFLVLYLILHVFFFSRILIRFRKGFFLKPIKVYVFVWLAASINYFIHFIFQDILYIGFPVFFFWFFGAYFYALTKKKTKVDPMAL